MTGRYWTTAEVKQIQQRYGFEPVEKIAADLGRSANSIRLYVSRHLGIKSKRPYAYTHDPEQVTRMIWDGYSAKAIAERFGTTHNAITKLVKHGAAYEKADYQALLNNNRRHRCAKP